MRYDYSAIRVWLADAEMCRFFGEPKSPTAIKVRPLRTTVLATLNYGQRQCHVVVKQFAVGESYRNATHVFKVHNQLRSHDPAVADITPKFFAVNEARGWIAMEYVPGLTLRQTLEQSLAYFGHESAAPLSLFETAGAGLAMFHRNCGTDLKLPGSPRENSTFIPHFEAAWANPVLQAHLPKFSDAAKLLASLPSAFFSRSSESLIPVDARPKNTLIRIQSGLCFIDPAYGIGSAAMSAGLFAAAIDRIGLRYFSAACHERLDLCRRAFLAGYVAHAEPHAASELAFFYPWALQFTMMDHLKARPAFRWFLGRYYGARLRKAVAEATHFPSLMNSLTDAIATT